MYMLMFLSPAFKSNRVKLFIFIYIYKKKKKSKYNFPNISDTGTLQCWATTFTLGFLLCDSRGFVLQEKSWSNPNSWWLGKVSFALLVPSLQTIRYSKCLMSSNYNWSWTCVAEQILFFHIWVDKESQEAVYEGYLVSAGIGDHIFCILY